jgi:phage terminase large subunit-like protein
MITNRSAFYFDDEAADRAVAFFERYLKHQKGELAGQPLILDPWQSDKIIRPLFGWKRADGTRKYRTAYVEVPRKNGKTTLAAGVGAILTFADGEQGAEVYSAASDREQAAIAFDLARSMVETEPALRKRAEVYRRSIVVPATGSSYKVLSADARSKHGFNAHGIIFDEVHAQPNRELYDVLHTSTGARRQPVEFLITTAGVYDPESIAWQLHSYAERVLSGEIDDPSFLAVIYGAPKEADYREPAVWEAANPGIGISVKADYLAAESKRAEEEPSYENTFRRLHLNQWTEQVTRWIKKEEWEACEGMVPDLSGRTCFPALDLSTTTDISALALIFPPLIDGDPYYLLTHFWCPENKVRKASQSDRVPYDAWVRDGYLIATPGDVVDYAFIRARINELSKLYRFGPFAYDPWNATQLALQLQDEDGLPMREHRQGFVSMNEPAKEFERMVIAKQIVHGGNPVMTWMISNVSVKRDAAGNIKPDKERSTGRIDGVVATVMAVGMATMTTVEPVPTLSFLSFGGK